MPATIGWRAWRAVSLLFGALIPVFVWGFLLLAGSSPLSRMDASELLNANAREAARPDGV
jgi:hypothetical protein